MGAHPVLKELCLEAQEIASSPEHRRRRRLWTDFHALRPVRTPVSFALYTNVWERDIARPEDLRCPEGLARQIEIQLRARLWKARHIPDDEPLLPTVWLWTPRPAGCPPLWGVPLESRRSAGHGSYKPVPPLKSEDDLERVTGPTYREDEQAKRELLEQALDLTGGLATVKFRTDEVHYGPFEWAVRLRGMDNLLLDVVDSPGFVHRLMDRITEGMVSYHRQREAAGAVDAEESWAIHMHYDEVPPGLEGRVKGCWAYVHAQSAASLSPAMYEEFIQPYNERIAGMFGKVYYHGCEDLSAKARIIRNLPNLRLFHVSPWTPLKPVLEALGSGIALEVHSHPARVLFTDSPEDTRADLQRLHREAAEAPHILKLCDVESVPDGGQRLVLWARLAREVVERQN